MVMVGWVRAGMEEVDGMHVGQSQEGWSHVGALPQCEVIH